MPLKLVNATNTWISFPSNVFIDNIATGFCVFWVNPTTISPAGTQRNFFGKDAGPDRLVYLIDTNPNVVFTYAGSTGNCLGRAATSAFPALRAGYPCCFAADWSFGVQAPRLYCGNLEVPLTEPTSYLTQAAGSGVHDDSGSDLILGNAGDLVSSNTVMDGLFFNFFIANRLPKNLNELRAIQYSLKKGISPQLSCWFGRNGTGKVLDESGHGTHGTITGAVPTGDFLPRVQIAC